MSSGLSLQSTHGKTHFADSDIPPIHDAYDDGGNWTKCMFGFRTPDTIGSRLWYPLWEHWTIFSLKRNEEGRSFGFLNYFRCEALVAHDTFETIDTSLATWMLDCWIAQDSLPNDFCPYRICWLDYEEGDGRFINTTITRVE